MFALGAIVSSCFIPGFTGAFIMTQWSALSVLLPLTLWRSGPLTVFHWAGLLFIAYAALRLRYSPIFDDGVYALWMVCIMAGSFWLGSTLKSLRTLYAGLAVGASASSVLSIFQAFGFSGIPYVGLEHEFPGLYVNHVASGMILALVAVALVSERMWLWLPLLAPGIVLSNSRGGWLALAIGLLATQVRRLWIFEFVFVAGIVFAVVPMFGATGLWINSDNERLFIWRSAVEHLTWLGWGPGAFSSWLLMYNGVGIFPEYAHNDALQLVAEYGIMAIVPVGVFVFCLLRTDAREWPVVATFVTLGCYSMPLWVPMASFIAFVAAGRVVRDWSLVRSERRSRRFDFVPSNHRRGNHESGEAVPVVARA